MLLVADPRRRLPNTTLLRDRPLGPIGTAWLLSHTAPEDSTLRPDPLTSDKAEEDVGLAEAAGAIT